VRCCGAALQLATVRCCGAALQLAMVQCCGAVLWCGAATRNGAVLWCGAATRNGAVLWRCGSDLRNFLFFLNLLLDSFKREKEGEKKRKERDSKPVSRLY
jgi:hypothetical protein